LLAQVTDHKGIVAAVITPWFLRSNYFGRITKNRKDAAQVRWVTIDEAHLINDSDDSVCRAPYLDIKQIRPRLPSSVTFLGLTGSCNRAEASLIASGLGFQPGYYINARYSVDRPNPGLKYITRFLKHPGSGSEFFDLSFLIPFNMVSTEDIPSTLVICETIELGQRVMDFLDRLIPTSIPNHRSIIMPCNALLSSEDSRYLFQRSHGIWENSHRDMHRYLYIWPQHPQCSTSGYLRAVEIVLQTQ